MLSNAGLSGSPVTFNFPFDVNGSMKIGTGSGRPEFLHSYLSFERLPFQARSEAGPLFPDINLYPIAGKFPSRVSLSRQLNQ